MSEINSKTPDKTLNFLLIKVSCALNEKIFKKLYNTQLDITLNPLIFSWCDNNF